MNSPTLIIAINTFRELVRGKTLYASIFIAGLIVIVSALFGSVSVGDQLMVVKDFGLFSISVAAVAFAVITGASLLHKELERKTILNILSKPVKRWEFVLGKFLGMYATQLVFLFLTSLVLATFASMYDGNFDLNLLIACCFIALELLIICAATMFFSALVVTPSLSGLFSFSFFIAGRSVDYLLALIDQIAMPDSLISKILNGLYLILPHLPKLNISNEAVFGSLPSLNNTLWISLYTFSYATVLLIMASILFSKREFN